MTSSGRGYDRNGLGPVIAAGDLSSDQFKFVVFSASNTVTLAGANGKTVGILQDAPAAAGRAADVASLGQRAKLKIAATLTFGELITSDSSGLGVQVDAASEWFGAMVIQDGVANDIIEVLVMAGKAHAAD